MSEELDLIHNAPWRSNQQAEVASVLNDLRAIRTCENHPVKGVGRIDSFLDESCTPESLQGYAPGGGYTAGRFYKNSGVLLLSDAASDRKINPAWIDFRDTTAHELTHGLTAWFDPRTCTAYDNINDNPLVQEFMEMAGWDPTGRTLTYSKEHRPMSPRSYDGAEEDFAETLTFYLYSPRLLKQVSIKRYEFMDALMTGTWPREP